MLSPVLHVFVYTFFMIFTSNNNNIIAPRVPALQVPGGRDFVYAKQ